MADEFDLLPRPRRIARAAGVLALAPDGTVPASAGPDERIDAGAAGIPEEGYRLVVTPEPPTAFVNALVLLTTPSETSVSPICLALSPLWICTTTLPVPAPL